MIPFSKTELEYLQGLLDSEYFYDSDPSKNLEAKITGVSLILKNSELYITISKEKNPKPIISDFIFSINIKDSGQDPISFPSWQAAFRYVFFYIGKEGFETDENEDEENENFPNFMKPISIPKNDLSDFMPRSMR
jgi:hypothetical protein